MNPMKATLVSFLTSLNESKAMTSIKCTDLISPPITTRPTSFVTIRPTNKIQIFLLIISQWRKGDSRGEITKTVIIILTDKKGNQ